MVQKLSHPPRWDNNFEPRSQFMSGFSEELFITLLCCCCLVLRLKTSGSLEPFRLWPHFMDWIRFHIGADSLFQTLWPMQLQLLMWELFGGRVELGGQLLMWELFGGRDFVYLSLCICVCVYLCFKLCDQCNCNCNCWCGNYLLGFESLEEAKVGISWLQTIQLLPLYLFKLTQHKYK